MAAARQPGALRPLARENRPRAIWKICAGHQPPATTTTAAGVVRVGVCYTRLRARGAITARPIAHRPSPPPSLHLHLFIFIFAFAFEARLRLERRRAAPALYASRVA